MNKQILHTETFDSRIDGVFDNETGITQLKDDGDCFYSRKYTFGFPNLGVFPDGYLMHLMMLLSAFLFDCRDDIKDIGSETSQPTIDDASSPDRAGVFFFFFFFFFFF